MGKWERDFKTRIKEKRTMNATEERVIAAGLLYKYASNAGIVWYILVGAKKPCSISFYKRGRKQITIRLTQ